MRHERSQNRDCGLVAKLTEGVDRRNPSCVRGLLSNLDQGLVHAEAKSLDKAIGFLSSIKVRLRDQGLITQGLRVYDPVPKSIMRVAGIERAQLVIESDDRRQLQDVLEAIDRDLRDSSQGRISKLERIRWLIERDPISI